MTSPKVSIIVPTYNVEQFLYQCLESISNQTFEDFEVLIVIDGATDNSLKIAEDYCNGHDRFSVYWQENSGSGPARNLGIAKSRGDLLMFVDPDDWLEPELLKVLVDEQSIGDYDLVVSKRISVICNNDGDIIKIDKPNCHEERIIGQQSVHIKYLGLLKEGLINSPTEKLYKASLIRDHNIEFPDLRRSQDIVFNYRYYDHATSLFVSSYCGYNYRRLLSDIVGKMNVDYYQTIKLLYTDIDVLLKKWSVKDSDDLATYFFDIRLMSYMQRCADNNWNIDSVFQDDVINEIVLKSNSCSLLNRIVKYLLVHKKFSILYKLLRLVVNIKRLKKSL